MKRLLALLLTLSSLYSATQMVTYEVPSGRFGDQLLAYMHAKWIAYFYNMPLLYKPFLYSDRLLLDKRETQRTFPHYPIIPIQTDKTVTQNSASDAIFLAQFFPESPYDYKHYHWPAFFIDWDDPTFITLLRGLISPAHPIDFSLLPKERVTVALHIRRGSGDDNTLSTSHWPLKFPTDHFYLSQLKTLDALLHHAPLLVHLFTDASNPASIAQHYQHALPDLDIQFTYHTGENRYKTHVIDDLFDMMRYECLIRPESNYSIIAQKLGNFRIVIHPLDCTPTGQIIAQVIQKKEQCNDASP